MNTASPTLLIAFAVRPSGLCVAFFLGGRVCAFLDGIGSRLFRLFTCVFVRVVVSVVVAVSLSLCLNVNVRTFVFSVPTVPFSCSSVFFSFLVSGIRGSVGEFSPESREFSWYSCYGPFLPHRALFPSFPVFWREVRMGGGKRGNYKHHHPPQPSNL